MAVEATRGHFPSRFLIKLPICINIAASRWGESPFTLCGTASGPRRREGITPVSGSILQGDVGPLHEDRDHMKPVSVPLDQCTAVASPFSPLISAPLYRSPPITPMRRANASSSAALPECSASSRSIFTILSLPMSICLISALCWHPLPAPLR